jgi:hypothetical protein
MSTISVDGVSNFLEIAKFDADVGDNVSKGDVKLVVSVEVKREPIDLKVRVITVVFSEDSVPIETSLLVTRSSRIQLTEDEGFLRDVDADEFAKDCLPN